MAKPKIPRQSTAIDMTAMCDVAFLLLTFFMLATKFKPDEPVTVRTPSSVSTDQIPEGFIQLTMDKEGRVFFSIDNLNAKRDLINKISDDKALNLTENQKQAFVTGSAVGHPFAELSGFLAATPAQQSQLMKTAEGVPIDTVLDYKTNEVAYWITATRYVLPQARFAIKVDGETPYPQLKKITETFAKLGIWRFNFITDQRGVPAGTELYNEVHAGSTKTNS